MVGCRGLEVKTGESAGQLTVTNVEGRAEGKLSVEDVVTANSSAIPGRVKLSIGARRP